jgi:hypothetical protein
MTMPLSSAKKAQSVVKDVIEHISTDRWSCAPTSKIEAEGPEIVFVDEATVWSLILLLLFLLAPVFSHLSRKKMA